MGELAEGCFLELVTAAGRRTLTSSVNCASEWTTERLEKGALTLIHYLVFSLVESCPVSLHTPYFQAAHARECERMWGNPRQAGHGGEI